MSLLIFNEQDTEWKIHQLKMIVSKVSKNDPVHLAAKNGSYFCLIWNRIFKGL